MSDGVQDDLWPYFAPLWTDLRTIAPGLLLAGGYGLFLKQKWLISKMLFLGTESGQSITTEKGAKLVANEGVRTLVAIHRWKDQAHRVTKDFDFIASLDLIASPEEQRMLDVALVKHGFKVVPANARWQFEKKVSTERKIVLDFHAPSLAGKREDLRFESRRVKPHPSLSQTGIHGRMNPEAIRSDLHSFCFTCDGVTIVLPNSVTFVLMKLGAMRDRWQASQNASKSAEERRIEEVQARKHAEDVCRVIAMITREENELADNILDAVRATPVFSDARETFAKFFHNDEGWGSKTVTEKWQPGFPI